MKLMSTNHASFSDKIHLTSDSDRKSNHQQLQENNLWKYHREVILDGLPEGDLKEGDYIYESPDSGKTVFRRKFQDYKTPKKK